MRLLLLFLLLLSQAVLDGYHITILGCGYVGLTVAALLGKKEHSITCVDVDQRKILALRNKKIPIYEPDLENLLFNRTGNQALSFVSQLPTMGTDIYYICVPTPIDSQGNCDCSFVYAAYNTILEYCTSGEPIIICVKSTVQPGTMETLYALLKSTGESYIQLVYNPEFMREGTAFADICTTNPIILGSESAEAMAVIENLYAGIVSDRVSVIKTDVQTAEMIKYAWNSFSAIRISFVNELAIVCRALDADINTVVKGFALSEELLPTAAIKPGPGYGGSCLPKDTQSCARVLEKHGVTQSLVHQAIASNAQHKKRIIADILGCIDCSKQPVVTLLGLSFKANTNDIRYAPAIDIIQVLLERGVMVKAYDPKAMDAMEQLFPSVTYCASAYEAAAHSDCVVVLTEWQEIKDLDLKKIAALCNKKVIVDTKNLYSPGVLKNYGFVYINLGAKNDLSIE